MKKYNVIYADPPWSYDNNKTGRALNGTGANMAADDKYNTMDLQQLCDMPVNKLAEKDCILFLWAVVPMRNQRNWKCLPEVGPDFSLTMNMKDGMCMEMK